MKKIRVKKNDEDCFSACGRTLTRPLLMITLLLGIANSLTAQIPVWCKTITIGDDLRSYYECEERDYLGVVKYNTEPIEEGVQRLWVRTLWISEELYDDGGNGDPFASDSVYWLWKVVGFGDLLIISDVFFTILDGDSSYKTAMIGTDRIFPDARDAPTNLSPSWGERVYDDRVLFEWDSVENVDYYALYVWDREPSIEQFSDGLICFVESLDTTCYQLSGAALNNSEDIYWMVLAYDAYPLYGGGIEMAHFEFASTAVDDNQDPISMTSPADFSVFPNPCNSFLQFSYNSTIPGMMQSFHIYDLSGRRLQSFSGFSSGQASVDLTSFPSGEYILEMSNPSASIKKQFTVVK